MTTIITHTFLRQSTLLLASLSLVFVPMSGFLSAATLVYFEEDGGVGNPRGFYNFDTTTAVSSLRAEVVGGGRFFSMAKRPSDGKIFAISPNDHSLYTVDINTGSHSVTTVLTGSSNVISDILNIAFDPTSSALYGIKRNGSGLYAIDQSSGQVTLVGPAAGVRAGLAFAPNGVLYATDTESSNRLYTLDTVSGLTTLVGGGGNSFLEDGTFTADGELFVTEFYSGAIFRYNLATGVQTQVGTTGTGSGLLGIVAVPEPSTLLLAVCGGAGLALFARRNQKHK